MAARVEYLTADQCRDRRAEVLASVGGNEDLLRERNDNYTCNAQELAAIDEINAMDYLLSQGDHYKAKHRDEW